MADVSDQQIEQLQRWARACGHQGLVAATIVALDQCEPIAFVPTGEVIDSIAVYEIVPCAQRIEPRLRDEARRYVSRWLAEHPRYRKELLPHELGFDDGFPREPTEPITTAEPLAAAARPRCRMGSAISGSWREVLGGAWPALDSAELLALAHVRYARRVSRCTSDVDVAALSEALQAAAAELGLQAAAAER